MSGAVESDRDVTFLGTSFFGGTGKIVCGSLFSSQPNFLFVNMQGMLVWKKNKNEDICLLRLFSHTRNLKFAGVTRTVSNKVINHLWNL